MHACVGGVGDLIISKQSINRDRDRGRGRAAQ